MRDFRLSGAGTVLLSLGVVVSQATAGPDWVEIGTAGSTLHTAQIPMPLAGGVLNSIAGHLTGPGDFSDMYRIHVADPANFRMEIEFADFNAQMFIFYIVGQNDAALGLLANDDRAPGDNRPLLLPIATDGTNARLEVPGDYLIGISALGHYPVSSTGAIFHYASNTEISGADGPGGFNVHIGWEGEGTAGSYRIGLTGSGFPLFPNPGTMAPLAMAAVMVGRRRR